MKQVNDYHQTTKHQPRRYARSPGYMDWDNQPNPFRFWKGTPQVDLPFHGADPEGTHSDLYRRGRRSSAEMSLTTISRFLELALGISAWKSFGDSTWALRMNPSSGNLHPTECHLLLPPVVDGRARVVHYNAYHHALSERATIGAELWQATRSHFSNAGFAVALTSIFWREAWKYGERALRYTQHDVGHALAALRIAANLFGWRVTYLCDMSDRDIGRLLGFDRVKWHADEEEHADLMVWVHDATSHDIPRRFPDSLVQSYTDLMFVGQPERLSPQTTRWDLIYDTARYLDRPSTQMKPVPMATTSFREEPSVAKSATSIIRERRSAQQFDRQGYIHRDVLLSILDKTLPRCDAAPFDVALAPPRLDLVLFVHRVRELPPGLYYYSRVKAQLADVQSNMDTTFLWEPVGSGVPLYLLKDGDFQEHAADISCFQDIAGDSAVSFGMVAQFKRTLEAAPWEYKSLFWESGMIGQVLYLEAEAHDVRGTGIGCYFDDPFHALLGLRGNAYQSLYHFTIGKPIDDPRLTTLPSYHHLNRLWPSLSSR
ncbi:MAG: SagB/ThcOx family dehydrogenase [Myxococcota bacterium]|nr:SagB/ThcOx family dehydrogenase [Myxococcota bacterium]